MAVVEAVNGSLSTLAYIYIDPSLDGTGNTLNSPIKLLDAFKTTVAALAKTTLTSLEIKPQHIQLQNLKENSIGIERAEIPASCTLNVLNCIHVTSPSQLRLIKTVKSF